VHVAVPVDAGANFNIRDFTGSVFAMRIGRLQGNQQHHRTNWPEEFEDCPHEDSQSLFQISPTRSVAATGLKGL